MAGKPDGKGATDGAAVADTTVVAGATSEPVTPTFTTVWDERVGGFAKAVGKPIDEVANCLTAVIGDPSEDALAILSDATAAPDADIKSALASLKIPSGKINLHIAKLRGGATKPNETAAAGSGGTSGQALAILPAVPDETSFLEMLKTGGVLKVGVTEVIAAIKAGLANRVGLFDLPEVILKKMETFADTQAEPCGASFFRLQKLLTERRYGEILSVLEVPGSFVSERRKKEFFIKLDGLLWPALQSFQTQLGAWQQAWMQGAANPAMLMMAMRAQQTGGQMPPGMMAPPDTSPVRASGEAVVDVINKVFAGPGIPVARALAFDATRIMSVLSDATLPAQIGAGTKDQMLKELGVNVGADIVRTEQSLTRYGLAIMSLPKVTVDAELWYLDALIQLGASIPWDKLAEAAATSGPAGIGRPSRGGRT